MAIAVNGWRVSVLRLDYTSWTHILSQAQTRVGRVVEAQPACSIDVDAADLIQDVLTVFSATNSVRFVAE